MFDSWCRGTDSEGAPCPNPPEHLSHYCEEHRDLAASEAARLAAPIPLKQLRINLSIGMDTAALPAIQELLQHTEKDQPDILNVAFSGLSGDLELISGSNEGAKFKIQDGTATYTLKIPCTFFAVGPGAMGCVLGGSPLVFSLGDDVLRDELARLRERNRALGLTRPEQLPEDAGDPPESKPARRRAGSVEPLPERIQFPADRIQKGVIEGFSWVREWKRLDGFHRGHVVSTPPKSQFSMQFGFRTDPGEAVWQFLLSRGEAAIKAHYALFARMYEQTGGVPGEWVTMNVNQFCSDLGYKPARHGGYKVERKQEVVKLLEALTAVEMTVEFTPAGKDKKRRRLRGPLWTRGLIAEEQDRYDDLLGQGRIGDPSLWNPVGFTYGPGPWFSDAVWRRQNRFLGLIGAGLMQLQPDNDQAAIRIGGYLGTLARFDQYRPYRIRVSTLLERIGMAGLYPKDAGKLRRKIEAGFHRLAEPEVGVFASWEYTDAEPDEPDMDDPAALAALADYREIPWKRRVIEVHWPAALATETRRLEKQRGRAIAAAAERAKKTPALQPPESPS